MYKGWAIYKEVARNLNTELDTVMYTVTIRNRTYILFNKR
jgi:hypothetical protein